MYAATIRGGGGARTLVGEAEMSSDPDDQSAHRRDELRGTEAGRDPWFAVRLMRIFEESEQPDSEPGRPEADDDDGRPR